MSKDNWSFSSYDGAVYSRSKKSLYLCPAGKTEIDIPDTVEIIYPHAFENCSRLKEVILPDSVKELYGYVFYGCTALERIWVGSGIEDFIWEWNLGNNPNLTAVMVDENNPTYLSVDGVVFSKDQTVLHFWPSKISELKIPAATTSIEEGSDSPDMIRIEVAEENPAYRSIDGVLYNKEGTVLLQCPQAKTEVHIPDTVTEIRYNAFYNCNRLTQIDIPETVAIIGSGVFSGCSGLTKIEVPEAVTKIEYNTFENCTGLIQIDIPDTVTSIGGEAFKGCSGLKQVELPEGLERLGDFVF